MNKRNSKFIPPLKSAFDFKTQEMMRQAVNALLNGQVVGGSSDQVLYADGNTIWQHKLQTIPDAFYPFKIYNIGGTMNFQIRDGLLGYRSRIFLHSNLPFGYNQFSDIGNYELPIYCPNTDLNDFPFDFDRQPTANPTVITLNVDGSPTDLGYGADAFNIAVPQIPGAQYMVASFWLQMNDDSLLGCYAELYGQVVDFSTLTPPYAFYPQGGNIVPIGLVFLGYYGAGSIDIQQYQWGNLTNRYLQYATVIDSPSPGYSPDNLLGSWTASNLADHVFYNGDVVIDDSVIMFKVAGLAATGAGATYPGGTDISFYGIYMYAGGINIETISPVARGYPTWELVGVTVALPL